MLYFLWSKATNINGLLCGPFLFNTPGRAAAYQMQKDHCKVVMTNLILGIWIQGQASASLVTCHSDEFVQWVYLQILFIASDYISCQLLYFLFEIISVDCLGHKAHQSHAYELQASILGSPWFSGPMIDLGCHSVHWTQFVSTNTLKTNNIFQGISFCATKLTLPDTSEWLLHCGKRTVTCSLLSHFQLALTISCPACMEHIR